MQTEMPADKTPIMVLLLAQAGLIVLKVTGVLSISWVTALFPALYVLWLVSVYSAAHKASSDVVEEVLGLLADQQDASRYVPTRFRSEYQIEEDTRRQDSLNKDKN